MEDICRVSAGIMPGPIASLTMMNDLQLAQLNGTSDHPQEMTTRHCHDKADKLSAVVQTIIGDIQRLSTADGVQPGLGRAGGDLVGGCPGGSS